MRHAIHFYEDLNHKVLCETEEILNSNGHFKQLPAFTTKVKAHVTCKKCLQKLQIANKREKITAAWIR